MSIVLEELTKRYAGHPVVNGVSLEVADGELFVLLGSSGSGKSTLLRMIGSGLAALEARTTRDDAVTAVAREAERQPCDLLILTPPPREGLERAEQALPRCRC